MAFKVTIKNEAGEPISGYLYFTTGGTDIPVAGGTIPVTIANGSGMLDDKYRNSGWNVEAFAEGYRDFIMPSAQFQDDNDIILEKKPNILLIVIVAAVGGYVLNKLIG